MSARFKGSSSGCCELDAGWESSGSRSGERAIPNQKMPMFIGLWNLPSGNLRSPRSSETICLVPSLYSKAAPLWVCGTCVGKQCNAGWRASWIRSMLCQGTNFSISRHSGSECESTMVLWEVLLNSASVESKMFCHLSRSSSTLKLSTAKAINSCGGWWKRPGSISNTVCRGRRQWLRPIRGSTPDSTWSHGLEVAHSFVGLQEIAALVVDQVHVGNSQQTYDLFGSSGLWS